MTRRKASVSAPAAPPALLGDIRALIEASRQRVRVPRAIERIAQAFAEIQDEMASTAVLLEEE